MEFMLFSFNKTLAYCQENIYVVNAFYNEKSLQKLNNTCPND